MPNPEEIDETQTAPEDETEAPEEILSLSAYQLHLHDIRWGLMTRLRDAEAMVERLDYVLNDPELRAICLETETTVRLIIEDKPEMGFGRQVKFDIPEGCQIITPSRYKLVIKGPISHLQAQIDEISSKLEELEILALDPSVRVDCYRKGEDYSIEITPKGPFGFCDPLPGVV